MKYQRRPIKLEGYEMYEADTEGNIYNKNGTLKVFSINKRGYYIVTFCVNAVTKSFSVHSVIAKTFLPPPDSPEKNQVNHKDGNKLNNNVDNLEWVTQQENALHSTRVLGNNTSIKNGHAKAIIGYDKKTGEKKYEFGCLMDAAKYFCPEGKNPIYIQNIICSILKKRPGRKSYRGCTWEYANLEDVDKQ